MKIEVSEGSANQDFGIRLNLYGERLRDGPEQTINGKAIVDVGDV